MKPLLLLLLFLSSTLFFAQTPGYLGKKISLEGDINVLPRFTNMMMSNLNTIETTTFFPSPNGTGGYYYTEEKNNKHYKNITYNLKASLTANYTVSKKLDLSIRYCYIQNSIIKHERYMPSNGALRVYPQTNYIPYNVNEFDFNLKFYKTGFIAPIGKYITLGIGYATASPRIEYNLLYTEQKYITNNSGYDYYETVYGEKTFNKNTKATFIKYNIGVGNKKRIKEYLYFHYLLEANFYSLGKYNAKILGDNEVPYGETAQETLDKTFGAHVGRHLAFDNIFNLKIGFGIIL